MKATASLFLRNLKRRLSKKTLSHGTSTNFIASFLHQKEMKKRRYQALYTDTIVRKSTPKKNIMRYMIPLKKYNSPLLTYRQQDW